MIHSDLFKDGFEEMIDILNKEIVKLTSKDTLTLQELKNIIIKKLSLLELAETGAKDTDIKLQLYGEQVGTRNILSLLDRVK